MSKIRVEIYQDDELIGQQVTTVRDKITAAPTLGPASMTMFSAEEAVYALIKNSVRIPNAAQVVQDLRDNRDIWVTVFPESTYSLGMQVADFPATHIDVLYIVFQKGTGNNTKCFAMLSGWGHNNAQVESDTAPSRKNLDDSDNGYAVIRVQWALGAASR
jgi:hypothetical protein